MAKQSFQIAFLCVSLVLLACGARLGVLYNGWAWFWAALALTVCAVGILTGSSRAERVGAVAAFAAFASGLVQGNDQNYPLIAWEWRYWPALAAALWVAGASLIPRNSRYWRELLCSLAMPCIYIYELVNNNAEYRGLIELAFAAMLLPSIGGSGGRIARIFRDAYSSRNFRNGRLAGVASARKAEIGVESAAASLRSD